MSGLMITWRPAMSRLTSHFMG
ncbi:hypothetical protein LINPERHAP2_LOCUS18963 [Linum perenne]